MQFHAPDIIAEIPEIKAIYTQNDKQAVQLEEAMEQLDNDIFLSTMGLEKIERWEKILDIATDDTEKLENRRFRVRSRVLEKLPYSYKVLIQRLEILAPGSDFFMDFDEMTFYAYVNLANKSALKDVQDTLEKVLPLNILIHAQLRYNTYEQIHALGLTYTQADKITYKDLRENPDLMSARIDYVQRSSKPTNVNSVEFNKICEWLDNLPLLATKENIDARKYQSKSIQYLNADSKQTPEKFSYFYVAKGEYDNFYHTITKYYANAENSVDVANYITYATLVFTDAVISVVLNTHKDATIDTYFIAIGSCHGRKQPSGYLAFERQSVGTVYQVKDLDAVPNLVGYVGMTQTGTTYDKVKGSDTYSVCYPCADRVVFVDGTRAELIKHNKYPGKHSNDLMILLLANGILTKNRKWR